jgi:hypothetical protein
MFGYRAAEIVGQPVARIWPGAIADGPRGGRDLIGVRKDGASFSLDLGIGEMRHDGVRLYIGVACDITEAKRAEEELSAASLAAESAVPIEPLALKGFHRPMPAVDVLGPKSALA